VRTQPASSLYPSRTSRNWTGAPGSHQRTWVEKIGAQPPPKLLIFLRVVEIRLGLGRTLLRKHSKNFIFNPGTLVRTWGTRPVPTGSAKSDFFPLLASYNFCQEMDLF